MRTGALQEYQLWPSATFVGSVLQTIEQVWNRNYFLILPTLGLFLELSQQLTLMQVSECSWKPMGADKSPMGIQRPRLNNYVIQITLYYPMGTVTPCPQRKMTKIKNTHLLYYHSSMISLINQASGGLNFFSIIF
jgi:hypothetical protein